MAEVTDNFYGRLEVNMDAFGNVSQTEGVTIHQGQSLATKLTSVDGAMVVGGILSVCGVQTSQGEVR